MTVAMSCPDRASLERLLDHGAAPDEVERLAGHLETCARCGETVETLLAGDRNAAALRGAKVEADAPSVQLLRARLAKLRPAGGSAAPQDTSPSAEAVATAATLPPAAPDSTQNRDLALAPPQQPDEIGRLGGYRILKELGRGGMGVVYQAEDPKLERLVALKVMMPGLAAAEAHRRRFLREARAMAAVHHDHIVIIHAVDEDDGVPFLAMEFLQGMPMDKWLKGGRKPTIPQVLRLGREIAEGLAAAHERGLIHRDVKPGNIWLDSSHKGRVKILDFGLARSAQEDVHLTQAGAIMGTPAYMSPEQARSEKIDARSDLFSLGCVLYRLCTGAMPFAGDNTMALLMALALDTPKPVRDLNPDVPAHLADLVTKLLAKDPAQRPQTAREVIQALQAVGRTQAAVASTPTMSAVMSPLSRPQSAPVVPPSEKPAPGGRKRRPWVLAAVAAGFLGIAIAAVVVIIRDKNGNKIAEVNVPPGGKVEVVDDGKKGDAAVAPKSSVDDAWVKQVAALPAEKQVEEVVAKLKELNPGFDGKVTPTIEFGVVTGLDFVTDQVTDISPVRALPRLKTLGCAASNHAKGTLADLSPLMGMQLGWLRCSNTPVSDLTPLAGMPLTGLDISATKVSDLSPLKGKPMTWLNCAETHVSDLSPLKGMPLEVLNCFSTPVSDLSPLKGMPLWDLNCNSTKVTYLSPLKDMKLTWLDCGWTPVSDLSPLKGMPLATLFLLGTRVSDLSPLKDMPLTYLDCYNTPVSDLSPLKDMKLTWLRCRGTSVSDLSPLKGMPLKDLWCDFKPERDAAILRSIKTLETIGDKPAADFWKDVDEKKPNPKP